MRGNSDRGTIKNEAYVHSVKAEGVTSYMAVVRLAHVGTYYGQARETSDEAAQDLNDLQDKHIGKGYRIGKTGLVSLEDEARDAVRTATATGDASAWNKYALAA